MICKKCGEINNASAKFCSACGGLLLSEEEITRGREEALEYFSEEPAFDRSQAKSPDEYFFTPTSYGEEEPYSGGSYESYSNERVISRPRRRSNAAYIATSLITAVLAVFNFVLPFAQWLSYQYSAFGSNLAQGDFSLVDIIRRFMEKDDIISFFIDIDSDYGISNFLPDSVTDKFVIGKIGAMIIGGIYALGLVLFVVFIILVLFRSRAAVGMGISASLIIALADAAFLFAINKFCSLLEQYDVYSMKILTVTVKPTPYLSIGLCGVIVLMCIVFAVLDRRRRR